MGINFRTIDTLARYVEHSVGLETKSLGKLKSVLHTKPSSFKNSEFKNLKPLLEDVFTRENTHFAKMTSAQRELLPTELHNTKMGRTFTGIMPEIRHKKFEKAFAVDENGKIIAESIEENTCATEFSEIGSNIIKEKGSKMKVGVLHNHPYESTLSSLDLMTFHTHEISTIMATTPGNGFASLTRKKTLIEIMNSNIRGFWEHNQDLDLLPQIESSVMCKFSLDNKSDVDFAKSLLDFNDKQIQRFTERNKAFDYKYELKKGKFNPKDVSDFSEHRNHDYAQDLAKLGASPQEAQAYLKEVIETPIGGFLLPI